MKLWLRDWEIVSPLGVGKRAFMEGAAKAASAAEPSSGPRHRVFAGFDKKTYLGKKGIRGMDELGGYAAVASQLLVEGDPELIRAGRDRIGVVLGTGSGSLASQMEFILDIHRQENAEWINPIQFPQTVMNCAAGQVGIWHGLTALNTTVSAGYHSGVSALAYAANALEQGRADRVLVGCAEEESPYRAQTFPVDGRRLRVAHPRGEGCFLAVAQRERPAARSAGILGARRLAGLGRLAPRERLRSLEAAVRVALGGRPEKLGMIAYNRFSSLEREMAEEMGRTFSAGVPARLVCSDDFVADCASATAGMQLALLLALGADRGAAPALALTFDPLGAAGFFILEPWETQ